MIIGLGYRARSGKDTVADFLVKNHGMVKLPFAGALKDAARAIFKLSDEQLHGKLKGVVDPFWGETPRAILQKLGTEAVRAAFGGDTWIKAVRREMFRLTVAQISRGVVVPDVRFVNEAQAIKAWGGYVIRVDRDGAGAHGGVTRHPSEIEMESFKQWDGCLKNNGTLQALEGQVNKMVEACQLEEHYT